MLNASTLTMLRGSLAALSLACVGMVGCQQQQSREFADFDWNNQARRDTNAWLVHTYNGEQVENAIKRQRTIWSHQFVEGTTSLTPRGERDLGILRDHYLEHDGGVLTLRQGEAEDELFTRRLQTVTDWLRSEGVNMAAVEVRHDLYRGSGGRSTRAAEDYVRPSSDEPYSFHEGSN